MLPLSFSGGHRLFGFRLVEPSEIEVIVVFVRPGEESCGVGLLRFRFGSKTKPESGRVGL